MRLPPDVLALLIKIKDYFLVLGPALLIAVSLKTALLAAIHTRPSKRWTPLEKYLVTPSAISHNPFTLFSPQWLWLEHSISRLAISPKNLWLETGALVASLAALLTALVLSPLLVAVRIGVGIALGLLGQARWSNFRLTLVTAKPKPGASRKSSAANTAPELSNPWKPGNLLKAWLEQLDPYLGWGLYNFVIAALLTIFVPLKVIENWFGPGQLFGPVLVPLLALLLIPATGSEMALVLALFTKGAGTGSGVTALLTFPLLTAVGLVEWQRRYGLKATIIFALLIWTGATGLGLLFDVLRINANV